MPELSDLAKEPRVLVLISGNGSNLQALLDSNKFNLVHVLSNRTNAYGLTRASLASIPTSIFALKPFLNKNPGSTRQDYDVQLAQLVLSHRPDLIVLAGFMHILSPSFLAALETPSDPSGSPNRISIINLHPALPGAFDGINSISRAYQAWLQGQISKTGVMIHRVVAAVDQGEPLVVKEIEFIKGESEEAFEERLHLLEHVAIVEGAQKAVEEIKERIAPARP